jgi:hypothetical protein
MKWFQSHNPTVSAGMRCNNLLKLKALSAPVSKSLLIPGSTGVEQSILALYDIMVF